MWKCKDCIHKDMLDNKSGICLCLCKDVYAQLNIENHCFQEVVSKPLNCGNCPYLKDKQYCSVSNWDSDERRTYFKYVRKNYFKRNTPRWCKL